MRADGSRSSSTNTLIALQRLHWLASGFGTSAYDNGSIAKVLSSDKDRASSPPDGLLKDNPPPSPQTKNKGYRERSEPAPGVARMGLMDFEARGSQESQVDVEIGGWFHRVPATTVELGSNHQHTRVATPRTPDDAATKKGANPNSGDSDEPESGARRLAEEIKSRNRRQQ